MQVVDRWENSEKVHTGLPVDLDLVEPDYFDVAADVLAEISSVQSKHWVVRLQRQ